MSTDAHILTLAQWLSPAYPVGAFAYSHGLEWAAEAGKVADGPSLRLWLEDVLCHGAGLSDARFLVAAFRAASTQEVGEIDATCRAFAASKERLMETAQQGAAFSQVTASVWKLELPRLAYPVAVGRAAALAGLPLPLTAKLYLQAFVTNLVGAGQRLLPVGQSEAQGLIRTLAPLIEATAETALAGTLDDLSATAFLSDIAAMKHETQHSRIFRT